MSQVDQFRDFIEGCLKRQVETLDFLEKHGPSMIRALVPGRVGVVQVPGFIKDKIADFWIDRLMEAIAYARRVNAVMQIMVRYLGSPDALRAASSALNSAVSSKAEDYALANLREDSLMAMSDPSQWSGPGSAPYAKSFDGQSEAFSRVSEYAGKMDGALSDMAKNIEDYYRALRDAAISLVEIIAGIVLLIATWETIIGGIVGVILAIIGVVSLINALTDLSDDQMLTTQELLSGLNSDIQAWPKATFATP